MQVVCECRLIVRLRADAEHGRSGGPLGSLTAQVGETA